MKLIGDKIYLITDGFCYKPPIGCFGFATSVLIKDDLTILFDTGSYGLRDEIKKIKKVYNIDYVVVSHLHFDHCSNLDLFTSSSTKIIISDKELEYYKDYKNKDMDLFPFFDEIKDKLDIQTVNDGERVSKNCKIIFSPGHTKGHISLEVVDKGKKYLLCGDSIKTRKELGVFPHNTNAYDIMQAKNTRLQLLKNYKHLIFGHDTFQFKKFKLRRF